MKTTRQFETEQEAIAFLEGIEFVCDPSITAGIKDKEPCIVWIEDSSDD